MNNKGQTLVLFVVLLPVILGLLAFIFDVSYMTMEDNRLNDIARTSVRYIYEGKDIEEVKRIVIKNDKDIIIEDITSDSIYLRKDLKPIFGQIVGFDKYELKANVYGTFIGDKFIIKEKGN